MFKVKKVIKTRSPNLIYVTFVLEGDERIDISLDCDEEVHKLKYTHLFWDSKHKDWVNVTPNPKLEKMLKDSVPLR